MGYLTTITIKNDRLGEFENDPNEFAKSIFQGIEQANMTYRECSLYGGAMEIQPSRHADATTVYVHYGNTVFNLCCYSKDFKDLASRPEILESFIDAAKRVLVDAEAALKKIKNNS